MATKQMTGEEIFEKFDEITQKGKKLTKSNLDIENPDLYRNAVELFGSWIASKKAYYVHLDNTKDPVKNLERLLIKKVQEVEDKANIKVSENDKLNVKFIRHVEKTDDFLRKLIINTFRTWEGFYVTFCEYVIDEMESVTDEQVAIELVSLLKAESRLDEEMLLKKYPDMHDMIKRKYGSLSGALMHLLSLKKSESVGL